MAAWSSPPGDLGFHSIRSGVSFTLSHNLDFHADAHTSMSSMKGRKCPFARPCFHMATEAQIHAGHARGWIDMRPCTKIIRTGNEHGGMAHVVAFGESVVLYLQHARPKCNPSSVGAPTRTKRGRKDQGATNATAF